MYPNPSTLDRLQVPGSYGSFQKVFSAAGPVPDLAPDTTSIPGGDGAGNYGDDAAAAAAAGGGEGDDTAAGAAGADAARDEYSVPTLSEMGYPDITPPLRVKFPGGETEGLRRMRVSLADRAWVCAFEKPKTAPNALTPATTVLSPYLKFGCLSARLFYKELDQIYKAANGKHSRPPVSLHGQLMWREFNYLHGHGTPNFGKMVGNPICRQIPWDSDPTKLAAWRDAKTGFPFVDAIMTQLRTEGWIHHLARHMVACFLTRGDLWQSWEAGRDVSGADRAAFSPVVQHALLRARY